MRINNVYVFIAPNFGVKQAIRQALHDAVKYQVELTHYEVVEKTLAIFNATYDIGKQGNSIIKKVVGKAFLHSELAKHSGLVQSYVDLECQEVE